MINHAEQTEESVLDVVTTATGAFLVLHNDDVNTFDFVIECLVNVCKHDTCKQSNVHCWCIIQVKQLLNQVSTTSWFL
jgi:ATP-dependent Clp protease adapter protein ClpS